MVIPISQDLAQFGIKCDLKSDKINQTWLIQGDLSTALDGVSLASLAQFFVVAIVLNNAVVGIVTSLFLKVGWMIRT